MNKAQIKVITYEEDRLNYFTDLMKKAHKKYNRLFKKFKDAPILSEEYKILNDAGRESHFFGDVVEMLEKATPKQSEGEWIYDEDCECFVCSVCVNSALNNYRGLSVNSNFCPNCGARMKGGAE